MYTRVVLEENGTPLEFICESNKNKSLVGNIYVGRVESVLKGMKSCFVDIGTEKNVYLDLSSGRKVKQGDSVLIRIVKDPIGEKGAVGEEKLSFTGRFSVLIPNDSRRISFSQKIKSSEERERIGSIIEEILPEGYGIIVRTEGEGKNREEFEEEINSLYKEAEEILKKADYMKPPCLMKQESSLILTAARDIFSSDVEEFVVNKKEDCENLLKLLPERKNEIKLYEGNVPVFENYFMESKLEKLFSKKVWLKSGGFLIIEQTEACVVIDVNTGKFTGKKDFEATKLKTNIEAAEEIARQMRLRNLVGMIIVEFIDMKEEENKITLENALREYVKKDRIKTTVVGMTELGLMQITRKKTRIPVITTVSESCTGCGGRGYVPSAEYTADKILRQAETVFANTIFKKIIICTNRRILKALKADGGESIKAVEEKFGRKIELKEIETGALDYFEIEKL